MKKFITLLILSIFAVSEMNAEKIRRTWDFTKGFSETSIAMFNTDVTSGSGYWNTNSTGFESKARAAGPLVVKINGVDQVIPETEGLIFGAKSSQHLNVIITPQSSWPEGGAIWFNGKKDEDCVTVPLVPAHENVRVAYTTHKNGEGRGFSVVTAGFADEAGNKKFTTSDGSQNVEVTLINSNDVDSELKLKATNGFHISYIIIGEGDVPVTEKIGFLYDGSENFVLAEDPLYKQVAKQEMAAITPIDINAEIKDKQLLEYSAIVLSNNIPADNVNVSMLKDAIAFVPTLNCNPDLYEAWGLGTLGGATSELGVLTTGIKAFSKNLEINTEDDGTMLVTLTNGDVLPVPLQTLTGKFADDEIYMKDLENPELILSHAHNIGHNGYIYLPYSKEAASDMYEPNGVIINNALTLLCSSKAEITPTGAPIVLPSYAEMQTTIAFGNVNDKAQTYYTLDGSEPTLESTLYTEPIVLTNECTVKAIAIAEGYTLSEVTTFDVVLKHQAKKPIIAISGDKDYEDALVALSTPEENVDIWYNFTGSTDTTYSSRYVAPLTIHSVQTLTAFALGNDSINELVQSEILTVEILANVKNIRKDVVSHFDANQTDYSFGAANNKGIFSWGASATTMYIEDVDPETGELVNIPKEPEVKVPENAEAGWKAISYGECVIWQDISPGKYVGDESGYNPARAEDCDLDKLLTGKALTFYKWISDEGHNASIETRDKIEGPFDVMTYATNTSGSSGCAFVVEVSLDSLEWTQLGDTCVLQSTKRLYNKHLRSYGKDGEVYVRVRPTGTSTGFGFFDIIILNEGEKSKEMEEKYAGMKGDANDDGQINVNDITTIAAYILNGNAENFNYDNADVNNDGQINVNDITGTAAIILGN